MKTSPAIVAMIRDRFAPRTMTNEQLGRFNYLLGHAAGMAIGLMRQTPECPEQARALDAIEHAVMLAQLAIVRHETPEREVRE